MVSNIMVLGTGGTISGAAGPGDNVGYRAGERSVWSLLGALGAHAPAGVRMMAEEVAQIDSKDVEFSLWTKLATRCQHYLLDTRVSGLVITHGTDTLEETAWFLAQVLPAIKPVVLTCAMRPATAISADGPQNLLDALALASDAHAVGVSVVCSGSVHAPLHVRKEHPYRVGALSSGDFGPLGWMEEGRFRSAHPWDVTKPSDADITVALPANAQGWPWVEVVQSHSGARSETVDALASVGVRGLVAVATGNGTLHHALEAGLHAAIGRGVAVRVVSRCPEGAIVGVPAHGLPLASAGLSAVKARISLMLELMRP